MAIGMNLGVITGGDIATELASRGIRVSEPAPALSPVVSVIPSLPVLPAPEAPERPITVLPRDEIVYEQYLPIYPPAAIPPEDITEEIDLYTPAATETQETKGLDKGLLILIGITAFALMALAKPKPTQRTRGYTRRRYG